MISVIVASWFARYGRQTRARCDAFDVCDGVKPNLQEPKFSTAEFDLGNKSRSLAVGSLPPREDAGNEI